MDIVTVVNSPEVLQRHLLASLAALEGEATFVSIDNQNNVMGTNLARIYNDVLASPGADLIAFMHPDVTFAHTFLGEIERAIGVIESTGRQWGAMGIVGRDWEGEYRSGSQTSEPREVCCLDSCSLITRRSLRIRFSERLFGGFHCFVEDFCLQAHAKKMPCFVFPTEAQHHSATMRQQGAQWGDYLKYRRRLTLKWWLRFPRIYTC